MAFHSRRGRPRATTPREEIDSGTPELQRKRRLQLTVEPLDWLREHDIISPQQHWCGLHFRWLYTLRYGAFTPQSMDAAREQGIIRKREYEEWQQDREQEWRQILQLLEEKELLAAALDFCIYRQNIPPQWQQAAHRRHRQFSPLCEALQQMERLWCRRITFSGAS